MVTGEIIQQVFAIRTDAGTGTAFTVRLENKQYIVTARHVLDGDGTHAIDDVIRIDFQQGSTWHSVSCAVVGVGDTQFDIAVLAAPQLLARFDELALGTDGIVYGQDVYFLGFPFGLQGDVGAVNNGYPLPYVKKAIVSMVNGPGRPNIVLDGINNVGFSGGPVVFRNGSGAWQVAAVVSGFNTVRESTYVGDTDATAPYTYDVNTGLIEACPLEVALNLIRARPIGFPMESAKNPVS